MKYKIILLVISCLASLLAVEALFRIRVKMDTSRSQPIVAFDERGIKKHVPDLDLQYYDLESHRYNHLKTNAEGFMGDTIPLVAATGTERIAFLGDSFTEAVQVDASSSFISLLSNRLAQLGSKKYQLMNFGVGGQGTVEAWQDYHFYAKKYHPHLVVLSFYAGNDFADNSSFLSRQQELFSHGIGFFKTLGPAVPQVNSVWHRFTWQALRHNHSDLVDFLFRIAHNNITLFKVFIRLGIFKDPMGSGSIAANRSIWYFTDGGNLANLPVINFSVDILTHLNQEVIQDGARLVVVLIPNQTQVDKRYGEVFQSFKPPIEPLLSNQLLFKGIANEIPVLDLATTFASAINEKKQVLYFHERGHLTEKGHALVAEELWNFINRTRELTGSL